MQGQQEEQTSIQSTASGRRWSFPVARLLILTAILAVFSAAFFIPVALSLSILLAAGIVGFGFKFYRDNRELVEGATTGRFLLSSIVGLFRFFPGLLILLPAFVLVFLFDLALTFGTNALKDWVESGETLTIEKVTVEDRSKWDPRYWIGLKKKTVVEEIEFTKEMSAAIRLTVGSLINLLKIVSLYPWIFLGYITLRSYFYFWARAFVARGGQVTMFFPRYRT